MSINARKQLLTAALGLGLLVGVNIANGQNCWTDCNTTTDRKIGFTTPSSGNGANLFIEAGNAGWLGEGGSLYLKAGQGQYDMGGGSVFIDANTGYGSSGSIFLGRDYARYIYLGMPNGANHFLNVGTYKDDGRIAFFQNQPVNGGYQKTTFVTIGNGYNWGQDTRWSLGVDGSVGVGANFFLQNNGGTKIVTVKDNGFVGIGTTNPTANFEVNGWASMVSLNLTNNNMADGPALNLGRSTNYWHFKQWNNDNRLSLAKYDNGWLSTPYLEILQNGNIGIGTKTPNNRLDVNGGMTIGTYAGTSTAPASGMIISGKVGVGVVNPGTHGLQVGGSVKIGSTSTQVAPDNGLTVSGKVLIGGNETYSKCTLNVGGNVVVGTDGFSNQEAPSKGMAIEGSVGIGTSYPVQKLHVAGDAYKTSGGNTWATPSDIRLKKDITPYNVGLSALSMINPVSFKYLVNKDLGIVNDTSIEIGIIAQEVQKIPNFGEYTISQTEKGYLTYNSNALLYVLVNSIKELKAEIDQLKEQQSNSSNSHIQVKPDSKVMEDFADLPILYQNAPNPFDEFTTIAFHIPQNAKVADLRIFDINGNQILTQSVLGENALSFNRNRLKAGSYFYSLQVDTWLDTKVMIISQ